MQDDYGREDRDKQEDKEIRRTEHIRHLAAEAAEVQQIPGEGGIWRQAGESAFREAVSGSADRA